MGKLEQLRATVSAMFDRAETAEQLKQYAELNKQIDEVEKENEDLVNKHSELLTAYKEAVKHTSFKEKPKEVEVQPTKQAPSLETMLQEFMSKKNS